MSPDEIKDIAEAAADSAVAKMMFNLGLRVDDQEAILRARALMNHLGNQYDACQTIKQDGFKTAIKVFATAICTIILTYIGYLLIAVREGVSH